MGDPAAEDEINIINARRIGNPLDNVKSAANKKVIRLLRAVVRGTEVDGEISKYIVSLVSATRKTESLSLGASPRASLALMRISQAYAFMNGRGYVVPEDVASVFVPTVAHRVILNQEAYLTGLGAGNVLRGILNSVEAPYRGARK